MDPDGPDNPGILRQAARLAVNTEKYNFWHQVRVWMEQVGAFAEGGDNRAKGITNGLGYALYGNMDAASKKKIESVRLKGKLRSRRKNGDKFTENEANAWVNQVINIVALDTGNDGTKRLAALIQEVHDCYRGQKESYKIFADRFLELA